MKKIFPSTSIRFRQYYLYSNEHPFLQKWRGYNKKEDRTEMLNEIKELLATPCNPMFHIFLLFAKEELASAIPNLTTQCEKAMLEAGISKEEWNVLQEKKSGKKIYISPVSGINHASLKDLPKSLRISLIEKVYPDEYYVPITKEKTDTLMRRLFKEGQTIRHIALSCNYTLSSVYRLLQKEFAERKKEQQNRPPLRKFTRGYAKEKGFTEEEYLEICKGLGGGRRYITQRRKQYKLSHEIYKKILRQCQGAYLYFPKRNIDRDI